MEIKPQFWLIHIICDDKFHAYVLELDDATKVLNDKNGNPINFGDMSMDLQVKL